MPRIKFLDILEETKHRTSFSPNISGVSREYYSEPNALYQDYVNTSGVPHSSYTSSSNVSPSPSLLGREERNHSDVRDRRDLESYAQLSKKKHAIRSSLDIDDMKFISLGILFIFLGGLLFITGYGLGKKFTSTLEEEAQLISDRYSIPEQSTEQYKEPTIEVVTQNFVPVDKLVAEETDLVQSTDFSMDTRPQTIKASAIEQVALNKKVAKKTGAPVKISASSPQESKVRYVIQVSAHSNLQSARLIEDKLRKMGYTSFICENMIGDTLFYRVRIRGYASRQETQKILESVRKNGFGSDSFILEIQ